MRYASGSSLMLALSVHKIPALFRYASDEETTAELKAVAGGRVKAVYAREGDSVRDVMLKHGSLAVLSLDGRMVVKVLCNLQLSVGETVTVTFENGTETEGRVESCLNGTAVVSLGQTAQVQVDALKDRTFEATVTAIGTHGTNNGGNSKFTVELTLPRGENMLTGMYDSTGITLDTTGNVLTIPVAALCEQGSKTMVYTGYDPETGELTNPVAVTRGVSDGIHVEILSGLEAGDPVCYFYYEALAAE